MIHMPKAPGPGTIGSLIAPRPCVWEIGSRDGLISPKWADASLEGHVQSRLYANDLNSDEAGGAGVLDATLAHANLAAALAPDATVIARVLRKHPASPPASAKVVRVKQIGEEDLVFLRYSAAGGGG